MSALSTLRYLTSSIVDVTTKVHLRPKLAESLEETKDYDAGTIERALDQFFGQGLKVV